MPDYSNTRIQVRRGTSAQWASANTVLASGEPGYDHGSGVLKVGDGVTGWNSLASIGGAGGPSLAQFNIVSGIAVYASGQGGGGGGGSSTFVGLSDTPSNFSSAGSKFVKVNSGASAVEFVAVSPLENVVEDTSPQLGGDLDLNSNTIVGAATFNEAGADVDFRVEGDTDQNLFFIDASTDRVGIGTNIPQNTLSVSGTFNANEINVSGSPAVYSSPTQANNSGIVNISGITNMVITDLGSYSGINHDNNTLYFVT